MTTDSLSTDAPLSPTGKLRKASSEPPFRQGWKVGRKKSRWALWADPRVLLALVAAVGVLACGAIVLKQQATPAADTHEQKAAPLAPKEQIQADVDRVYTINGTHWACKDEATLAHVDALLVNNDRKGLETLRQAGDITQLKSGQTVRWLGSSGYLGARVRLQLTGSKTELWASREALR